LTSQTHNEIWREFAPYIGVSWTRLFGNTADFAPQEGDEVDSLAFVVGVRQWW
jgi:copper resistance protein B